MARKDDAYRGSELKSLAEESCKPRKLWAVMTEAPGEPFRGTVVLRAAEMARRGERRGIKLLRKTAGESPDPEHRCAAATALEKLVSRPLEREGYRRIFSESVVDAFCKREIPEAYGAESWLPLVNPTQLEQIARGGRTEAFRCAAAVRLKDTDAGRRILQELEEGAEDPRVREEACRHLDGQSEDFLARRIWERDASAAARLKEIAPGRYDDAIAVALLTETEQRTAIREGRLNRGQLEELVRVFRPFLLAQEAVEKIPDPEYIRNQLLVPHPLYTSGDERAVYARWYTKLANMLIPYPDYLADYLTAEGLNRPSEAESAAVHGMKVKMDLSALYRVACSHCRVSNEAAAVLMGTEMLPLLAENAQNPTIRNRARERIAEQQIPTADEETLIRFFGELTGKPEQYRKIIPRLQTDEGREKALNLLKGLRNDEDEMALLSALQDPERAQAVIAENFPYYHRESIARWLIGKYGGTPWAEPLIGRLVACLKGAETWRDIRTAAQMLAWYDGHGNTARAAWRYGGAETLSRLVARMPTTYEYGDARVLSRLIREICQIAGQAADGIVSPIRGRSFSRHDDYQDHCDKYSYSKTVSYTPEL